ncbi:MAG: hypothetical protein V4793_25170 [Paraburkholderia tropica]
MAVAHPGKHQKDRVIKRKRLPGAIGTIAIAAICTWRTLGCTRDVSFALIVGKGMRPAVSAHLRYLVTAAVVFVRRQSPDWQSLSRDYRQGLAIDPSRYVPDHPVPGFPDRLVSLIGEWNRRFSIDFFTFRHAVAMLSRRNISAIPDARMLTLDQLSIVAQCASVERCYVYFHDDDDFFAPHLPEVIRAAKTDADSIVTPLFRLGSERHSTFVTGDITPDFQWGERKPHDFRYQTNNYGIAARRCTTIAELSALKDHVLASRYADEHGFRDELLPSVSMLHVFRGRRSSHRAAFDAFLASCRHAAEDLPSTYNWLSEPLGKIHRLVEHVYRGDGYVAIHDLLGEDHADLSAGSLAGGARRETVPAQGSIVARILSAVPNWRRRG